MHSRTGTLLRNYILKPKLCSSSCLIYVVTVLPIKVSLPVVRYFADLFDQPAYCLFLTVVYNSLAITYEKWGHFDKAVVALKQSLDVLKQELPPNHLLLATCNSYSELHW